MTSNDTPKMDDDGLTREQAIREAVARGWCDPANSHKEMDAILAESIVREVCALESRSEVLDQSQADVVLHAHTEICDLFAQNSGDYDPSPDEVDRVHDGLTFILGNIAAALKSPRAEPGAPFTVRAIPDPFARTMAGGVIGYSAQAEHEPNAAEQERIETAGTTPETGLGQTKPASAASEPAAPQVQGEGGDCRPMPDPGALTGTLPSESPVTAAASDVKEWAKRVCDSTNLSWEYLAIQVSELLSSSHARGLEEAAKVCEIYFDDEDEWLTRQMREVADVIRAKIKPARGET